MHWAVNAHPTEKMNFSSIRIRRITTDDRDTDFIVSLRNDPEVRKMFLSAETVTKEGHLKYLAKVTLPPKTGPLAIRI